VRTEVVGRGVQTTSVETGPLNAHARATGDATHGSQWRRDTQRTGHCQVGPIRQPNSDKINPEFNFPGGKNR
jgi:hypothetical protein